MIYIHRFHRIAAPIWSGASRPAARITGSPQRVFQRAQIVDPQRSETVTPLLLDTEWQYSQLTTALAGHTVD
jgi:hypothetical protein